MGKYRKNHIPHSDGYQEKYYFRPGDLGYPVFATPYGRLPSPSVGITGF